MSSTEDIVYKAYDEGIRDALFIESNRLTKLGGKYKHMEIGEKFEIAYANITKKQKTKTK